MKVRRPSTTTGSSRSNGRAMAAKTRRSRTGCLTCRDRHVKCDEGQPSCERCTKVGRECIRGWNVKFLHGVRTTREMANDEWDGYTDYLFDEKQKWVPVRAINMSFVDETDETRSWYTCLNASTLPALQDSPRHTPASPPPPALPQSPRPSPFANLPTPAPLVNLAPAAPLGHPPAHRSHSFSSIRSHSFSSPHSHAFSSPHDPNGRDFLSPNGSFHDPFLAREVVQGNVNPLLEDVQESQGELDIPTSPISTFGEVCKLSKLSDSEEAYLLHHYIVSRARLLDICDPHSHFGRTVPELATKSPLLLNAVLAVSAHHLSRTAGYDPLVAEMYHERCVELLIPLLDDLSTVSDEVVAATVLLRNFEQMSSAITGFDCEHHLSGTSAFMNSESTCVTVGGLRQASFWIFVRQDLDVALSQQRPLKLNLEAYATEMHLDTPSDDWGWANSIVWITAEVVAFSFGWEKARIKYEELKLKAESWWQRKPRSFQPLYVGKGPAFPAIYYSQTWHALGMQYYHTTMILLAIGDPSRLKIGFGRKESRRLLQEEIAHHAGLLFGICTTVDDIETKITACNAISLCAPWLTDRAQQETIIGMLGRVERDVAWPTRNIAYGAMDEWGWDEDDRRASLLR